MEEEEINATLRDLWFNCFSTNKWPTEFPRLWPMQYPRMPRNAVLFVGLNPSDAESAEEFRLSAPDELRSVQHVERVVQRERAFIYGGDGRDQYAYYRPFARLAAPVGDWAYLDLLPVRHRSQKQVKQFLRLDKTDWHPLAHEWLRASAQLLTDLRPVAIVVVNALAADLLLRWFERQHRPAEFDKLECVYRFRLGEREIPAFMAGMLTGQRALDRYSRERLAWHIRRHFKKP